MHVRGLHGGKKGVRMLLGKGQIMVIDDSEPICAVIKTILENDGYDIKKFTSAKDALMALRDGNPDLIVCDILMPEMDGFEFRRAIVEDQRTAYIPFIFLTGKDDLGLMIEGLSSGITDYINKPVQPKEFLTHVDRIMDNINEARFRLLDRILQCDKIEDVGFEAIEKVLDAIKFTGKLLLGSETRTPLIIIYKRGRAIAAESPDGIKGHDAYKLAEKMKGEFEVSAESVTIKAEF